MRVPAISSNQMAKVDDKVPEKYGITISRMMENAAYQIADFIRQNFSTEQRIVIYAGKGNNGGDGLAAARRLHNWGYNIEVVELFELDGIRKEELEVLRKLEIPIHEEPREADVAIDGLIGYDLKGDPRPPFGKLINQINSADSVVSIDVPSGVDADTGEGLEPHVKPDYVVTLGLPKNGLEELDSEIWLADISIPDEAYKEILDIEIESLFDDESLRKIG